MSEPFIPTWRDEALCREVDPEIFYPEKGGTTRAAKEVCGRCSVRAECLDYAMARDDRFGVWGGLSEPERKRLRRGEIASVTLLPLTVPIPEQPRRAA